MKACEFNFDGIVGLTHNYGGLSLGNVASMANKETLSNPREAALQGLNKMKFMLDLGIKQAVLPPQERPHISTLKSLGFRGSDTDIISKAAIEAPYLLNNCSSSSAMWTANAATVSPSADCEDKKVHFTPANLTNKFHRSIECKVTERILKSIFSDDAHFVIHPPLPQVNQLGDEGAANHTRLCTEFENPGLEFFVFGKYSFVSGKPKPRYFPARQTFEASQAIARRHNLKKDKIFFAQQSPIAIDAGVFHNDVISVGNQNVFLYHDQAFFDNDAVIKELKEKFFKLFDTELCLVNISAQEITVNEAVQTYLFNSQLVTLPSRQMAIIAPQECKENKVVKKCIDKIISIGSNPISEVHFLNVRQSMQNGGGPACLRLRVSLTEKEISHTNKGVILTPNLYKTLTNWIKKHYRDQLDWKDLADPKLLEESRSALDELTQILNLGSIYDFQGPST